MKLLKLNFIEFHKYFSMIFKEQPPSAPKYGPIKYPTYEVLIPFSRRKLQIMEILVEIIHFDDSFLQYLSKEVWSLIVDHLFMHEFCPLYH